MSIVSVLCLEDAIVAIATAMGGVVVCVVGVAAAAPSLAAIVVVAIRRYARSALSLCRSIVFRLVLCTIARVALVVCVMEQLCHT